MYYKRGGRARRHFHAGTGQMDMQEIDHPRITEVAWDDPHQGRNFSWADALNILRRDVAKRSMQSNALPRSTRWAFQTRRCSRQRTV
jgi:hypothetical protein